MHTRTQKLWIVVVFSMMLSSYALAKIPVFNITPGMQAEIPLSNSFSFLGSEVYKDNIIFKCADQNPTEHRKGYVIIVLSTGSQTRIKPAHYWLEETGLSSTTGEVDVYCK